MNIHKYLIDKFFASDMAKPAKTAGKRTVRYETVSKRRKVIAGELVEDAGWQFVNHTSRDLYITVQADFTKAGKK